MKYAHSDSQNLRKVVAIWKLNKLLLSKKYVSLKIRGSEKMLHLKSSYSRLIFCNQPRILETLAGCRTMFLSAVFCKVGALERNAYWFHVWLIFIVIFGQSFKLDVRAKWISQSPR